MELLDEVDDVRLSIRYDWTDLRPVWSLLVDGVLDEVDGDDRYARFRIQDTSRAKFLSFSR